MTKKGHVILEKLRQGHRPLEIAEMCKEHEIHRCDGCIIIINDEMDEARSDNIASKSTIYKYNRMFQEYKELSKSIDSLKDRVWDIIWNSA